MINRISVIRFSESTGYRYAIQQFFPLRASEIILTFLPEEIRQKILEHLHGVIITSP